MSSGDFNKKFEYIITFTGDIRNKVVYSHGWFYSDDGDRYSFYMNQGTEQEVICDVPARHVLHVESRLDSQ